VVSRLRELGHDVLTRLEASYAKQGIPDEAILASAVKDSCIGLTLNRRHFMRLHRLAPSHVGIIIVGTEDANINGLTERIHQAITANKPLQNKLVRVNRPNR
jgi:hypothetical protein